MTAKRVFIEIFYYGKFTLQLGKFKVFSVFEKPLNQKVKKIKYVVGYYQYDGDNVDGSN